MLKGTEKQVAWAEDIIRVARGTIRSNIDNIKNLQAEYTEKYGEGFKNFRQDELEAFEKCGESLEAMLANIDSAAKIIDMRAELSSRSILDMVDKYCFIMNIMKNKKNNNK